MNPNDFSEGINFSSGRIESPFFNINTPDDLEKAKYRLKKGHL